MINGALLERFWNLCKKRRRRKREREVHREQRWRFKKSLEIWSFEFLVASKRSKGFFSRYISKRPLNSTLRRFFVFRNVDQSSLFQLIEKHRCFPITNKCRNVRSKLFFSIVCLSTRSTSTNNDDPRHIATQRATCTGSKGRPLVLPATRWPGNRRNAITAFHAQIQFRRWIPFPVACF